MDIKLDTEKAYDRLKWDFIIKGFQDLRFSSQCIIWINQSITTTNFKVLVNN